MSDGLTVNVTHPSVRWVDKVRDAGWVGNGSWTHVRLVPGLGGLVGFALPLASTMIHSVTVVEMMLWGLVALVVQVLVYLVLRLPMPRLSERIDNGEVAAGIWLGSCSTVGGILNAAAMTT